MVDTCTYRLHFVDQCNIKGDLKIRMEKFDTLLKIEHSVKCHAKILKSFVAIAKLRLRSSMTPWGPQRYTKVRGPLRVKCVG